jgi:hypothetical protein
LQCGATDEAPPGVTYPAGIFYKRGERRQSVLHEKHLQATAITLAIGAVVTLAWWLASWWF